MHHLLVVFWADGRDDMAVAANVAGGRAVDAFWGTWDGHGGR